MEKAKKKKRRGKTKEKKGAWNKMKSPLEQKFIERSEFEQLGLEVKAKFFFPTNKQERKDVPNYLVVGKGKGRYILQRTIPLSALEENGAMYKVIDYYEVEE